MLTTSKKYSRLWSIIESLCYIHALIMIYWGVYIMHIDAIACSQKTKVLVFSHRDEGECKDVFRHKREVYCRYIGESRIYACAHDGEPSHTVNDVVVVGDYNSQLAS